MAEETDKPTTISQPLLLMLIETIQDLTREVEQLRGRNDAQDKHIEQLSSNVECLHRETERFRRRFEPYLVRALDSSKVVRSRKEKVIQYLLALVSGGAVVFTGDALFQAVADRIARTHVSGTDAGARGPEPLPRVPGDR